jgi:signal peptide peptidase SppA
MDHRLLFERALNEVWAITPDYLALIFNILGAETVNFAVPESLSMKAYERFQGTSFVHMEDDGVAVLTVKGPIVRYGDAFSDVSGLTSLDRVTADFGKAMGDEKIKGIVLSLDTPGGQVTGIEEFAKMVRAASATKPIAAYCHGQACSAGYWIGSAAPKVFTSATGMLGSIGVLLALRKESEMDKARKVEFVSSQSPFKRVDIESDEGKRQMQALVDRLADVFYGTVAQYRGVSVEDALKGFGKGGIFVGDDAVKAGLADEVGLLADAVAYVKNEAATRSDGARAAGVDLITEEQIMGDNKPNGAGDEKAPNRFAAWISGMLSGMSAEEKAQAQTLLAASGEEPKVEEPKPDPRIEEVLQKFTAMEEREKTLKAEAEAKLDEQKLMENAEAFFKGLFAKGFVFPTDRAVVLADHMQAERDDILMGADAAGVAFYGALRPGQEKPKSRVEALKTRYEARGVLNPMLRDQLPAPDETGKVLGNSADGNGGTPDPFRQDMKSYASARNKDLRNNNGSAGNPNVRDFPA